MGVLPLIILSTSLISLGSLAGIFTLLLKEEKLNSILLFLVSLSAGALIGGAFIHLLPEAANNFKSEQLFLVVLSSFVLFFLVEKILHWRHCHQGECEKHSFGILNLFGDSIHNFMDGLVLAGAFLTDVNLGIVTALAVGLHEIPQEIGDFGVLLYAGFKKKKALIVNFLVALMVVVGGIVGYLFSFLIEDIVGYLLAFAAGGFIYIAASDLMPEIRNETSLKKSLISFMVFIAGIILMFSIKLLGVE